MCTAFVGADFQKCVFLYTPPDKWSKQKNSRMEVSRSLQWFSLYSASVVCQCLYPGPHLSRGPPNATVSGLLTDFYWMEIYSITPLSGFMDSCVPLHRLASCSLPITVTQEASGQLLLNWPLNAELALLLYMCKIQTFSPTGTSSF